LSRRRAENSEDIISAHAKTVRDKHHA
jgi:hypothetical protein